MGQQSTNLGNIITYVKRARNARMVWGIGLVAGGAAIWWLARRIIDEQAELGIQVAGILFGMGGFFLLVTAIRRFDPYQDIIVKKLLHQPRDIVWVYSYVVENMPYGVKVFRMASIFFYMKNGKHEVLRVPLKELEPTMKQLNTLLPHATFGYSVEKEQLYKADPEMMYRD